MLLPLKTCAGTSSRAYRSFLPYALCATLVLFAFEITVSEATSRDAAPKSTTTREGRIAVFDDVWQTVRDRYYDPNFHGVDWIAQRTRFRPQAAEAGDPNEFYSVLRQLLAPLRDSHTRVFAPEEKFDWERPRFVSAGFSVREVEGQPVVVEVQRGSEAERSGLRRGDLLETIDGEPALSLFKRRLEDQTGCSTPQAARLRAMATILEGAAETTVQVGWRNADGKYRQASLRRKWRERSFALQLAQHGRTAVVVIDAFTRAIAQDFANALNRKPKQLQGIVFDLRNNGGGDAGTMADIASWFLPPATNLGLFTDRFGSIALTLDTQIKFFGRGAGPNAELPIVILTSGRTSSAAEIFVDSMKKTRQAWVIGSETCGCVLAIRSRHTLPDGGELDVSELDYRTNDGQRLEGHGITPNEAASVERSDLYAGRDRALEVALARIRTASHH